MHSPAKAQGKVYLVGAGPGDPGLITLKGYECLRNADVVLYDGLVNPLLLRHAKAAAEKLSRYGEARETRLPQETINERLIEEARAGKIVVRLKGGDPYIFGRGAEEAAALSDAGVAFEVVPGITAATAAGAYSGVSLTHRESSSAVAFVTGHEDPEKPRSNLDYQTLAAFPGTLVFYMGRKTLDLLAASLIACGKEASTSACLISRASQPDQQVVEAPLGELAAIAEQQRVPGPALVIVGECVSRRGQVNWFESLPLFGKTIGITRAEHQAEPQIAQAISLGAQPILLPTIEIRPPEDWSEVDAVIKGLGDFHWLIFTSANGVRFFLNRLWETGEDARLLGQLRIAAIGTKTAEQLRQYHLRADVIPDEFRAESLAAKLLPLTAGKRVLWAGASRGREVLIEELTGGGANVQKVVCYRNDDVESYPPELLETPLDWVAVSSPSIAKRYAQLRGERREEKVASISPVTSAACREAGLCVMVEAKTYTWEGLFEAIVRAESV